MKNAIVYAFHSNEKLINDNYCFEQVKTSIKTLRKYNSNIKVYLYLSPENSILEKDFDLNYNNLEIIKFNTFIDNRMTNKTYASWQHVKWTAAINCLKKFNLDNIIYIDTDTIFQKDPEYLFDKYGNTEYIYGRNDVTEASTSVLNINGGGMNDGIFILSKKVLTYIENVLKARIEYVYDAQEKLKNSSNVLEREWVAQWLSGQQGVFEYLNKINKPLQIIEDKDIYEVALYDDYKKLTEEEKNSYTIIHYFNYNSMYFCFESFKNAQIKHLKAEMGINN